MSDLRELNGRRCPAWVTLATGETGRCDRPWGHGVGFLWTNRNRSQHTAVVTIGSRTYPVTWYMRPDGVDVDVAVGRFW